MRLTICAWLRKICPLDTDQRAIAAVYSTADYDQLHPDSHWVRQGDTVTLRHVDEYKYYDARNGDLGNPEGANDPLDAFLRDYAGAVNPPLDYGVKQPYTSKFHGLRNMFLLMGIGLPLLLYRFLARQSLVERLQESFN